MKKGFKKFLGIAAVFSIFTGNAGIGASAYKFNAVSVASVPGMTEEEVKLMNAMAEACFILNEMVHTDSSQWFKFERRLKELGEIILRTHEISYLEKVWRDNFSKNSEWTNAQHHASFEFIRIVESNEELSSKLRGFLMYLGII